MSKIIVVGHKNPDTDSIVSAIAAKEYLSEVLSKEAVACRAGELNNETKFVLEKFLVEVPAVVNFEEGDEVALVDHNEISQLAEGLNINQVEYIFDHHKMAIATEKPIYCRMEPIGSTSSLIAKMFFEKGVRPSEMIAKLLLAGILSDTLNLTSPTTTEIDRQLVAMLNEIAKLEIPSFVDEMFKAKSSLEGISVEDIITLDYKNFEMGPSLVGVGTWETTSPESVNENKAVIMEALKNKKVAENLQYMYFMVVDILKESCQLYIIGEQEAELAKKVFGKEVVEDIMELPGVVSRKKQIVPQLTEELSK